MLQSIRGRPKNLGEFTSKPYISVSSTPTHCQNRDSMTAITTHRSSHKRRAGRAQMNLADPKFRPAGGNRLKFGGRLKCILRIVLEEIIYWPSRMSLNLRLQPALPAAGASIRQENLRTEGLRPILAQEWVDSTRIIRPRFAGGQIEASRRSFFSARASRTRSWPASSSDSSRSLGQL